MFEKRMARVAASCHTRMDTVKMNTAPQARLEEETPTHQALTLARQIVVEAVEFAQANPHKSNAAACRIAEFAPVLNSLSALASAEAQTRQATAEEAQLRVSERIATALEALQAQSALPATIRGWG